MKKHLLIIFLLSQHFVNGQCTGTQSYTLTPTGPYSPGQVVTVNYTLNNFTQINSNWIIAFDLNLGVGWASSSPLTAPANPGGSTGSWIWDTQNTYPSGLNFGPGYRFNNTGGNPNWGTSSTGPFSLSFQLTVGASCNPQDLTISLGVIGDCQTGGWNNGACCQVNYYSIYSGSSLGSGNISLTNINTNIDCFGANNGIINLNVLGGATPYSFNWSNGSSTQNISNLSSGIYTVTVTDNLGCNTTLNNLVITEPVQIEVISIGNNASCNNYLDGSASLTSPNSIITSYSWSNGQNTQTATNLSAGTYGYTVTDINGCTFTDSIIIYEPGILTASINTTNVICNGDNNGTASIQLQASPIPAGTVSTLSYCTSTPGSSTNSTIDNVQLIGDTFSINNNTAGICDQYEDYTNLYADVTEGQSYTIDVDLGDCSNNYSSGGKVYIDWNIDGDFNDPGEEVGVIPYGVASSASIPITIPFSGVYGATCMRIVSQFLNNIPVSSIGPCDVGVMANPIYIQPWFGATEDYSIVINSATITATYLWNTLATTDSIYNLNSGNYSVDITDGNGCTITEFITITEPTAISVIPTISDINCFDGNDGGIELNITGGNPDYTISVPPYYQILTGGISNFSTPNILSAGNYPYTITDSSNCSYSGTITLINPNPSLSITPITSCDSYSWNGTTYTASIIQTDTLINQNNCDSIATLNLTINNSSLSNTNLNECDSYLWNGTNYTTSGLYDSLFTNSANCDSLASLNLTINYSSSYVLTNTSCDSYLWGITNQTYTNSGIYTQISTNSVGCTHTDSLILNINNSAISATTLSACDSYIWNSNNYLISGIYTDTLTTSLGCDSIATLNLTITDTSSTLIAINSCDSFTWTANGQTYYSSIIDTILSTNADGCPNVDSLLLTMNYSESSIDTQVACNTYQWIDGNTYTTSNNTATFLTTNTNGCDSLISLNITINNSTSSFVSDNNCISYQWPLNNQTYTNSGIYTYLSVNAAGCTNTDTLDLTINNPNAGVGNINACFFYNWNGNTYSTSGIYTDTLSNIFGCDSIATLNLSISDTSYQMIAETECISYLWPITNTVYTNSGTYIQISTNANGCAHIDSLILIINNPTASYDTISDCDSYYWNGNTFNNSGNYSLNFTNSLGCDSIANLNLTISNSTSSSLSISECDSYYWDGINYNMSGTYIRTLNTVNGCDSIVTLNLIIISGTFDITTNVNITDVNCFGMNNGAINLYPNGGINPLTFNWDNGDTTQNITSLTAGNYNFTITDSIGCTLDSTLSVNEPDKLIVSFLANNEICRNDSISILIELTNPNYNYYTVQFYDSIQKSFVIDSSGVLIPEGIPFYIVPNFSNQIQLISVTDNNGCTSSINQPLDIIVNQLPVLEINQDDICAGTPSFTLNEGTPDGGDYFIDDENTSFFDVESLENGAYTIRYEYTDIITNCSNSIEKIININPNPIAEFSFSPQPADIDNPNILFVNESENIENTKWSLGDETNLIDELEFWHTYADTGKYNVIYAVSNQFNCSDTAEATLIINPVYQIFIPSAFTPNNDGDNDNFKLEIIGQKEYTMTIFNRWGEIIYKEKNGIWDGKLNNNLVQNGTYSYSILVSDFKDKYFIYTGIVNLIK
jgi:gliding motility-associated-like protein